MLGFFAGLSFVCLRSFPYAYGLDRCTFRCTVSRIRRGEYGGAAWPDARIRDYRTKVYPAADRCDLGMEVKSKCVEIAIFVALLKHKGLNPLKVRRQKAKKRR